MRSVSRVASGVERWRSRVDGLLGVWPSVMPYVRKALGGVLGPMACPDRPLRSRAANPGRCHIEADQRAERGLGGAGTTWDMSRVGTCPIPDLEQPRGRMALVSSATSTRPPDHLRPPPRFAIPISGLVAHRRIGGQRWESEVAGGFGEKVSHHRGPDRVGSWHEPATLPTGVHGGARKPRSQPEPR